MSTDRFTLYVPSEGRRSVGGQKPLFLHYISKVIAGGSVKPTEREIRHAAEDRDYWSHLVGAFRDNRFDPQTTLYSSSGRVVGKNVHATIPKGKMGYEQYTVPDDCSCRTDFSTRKHMSMASRAILSNFFEQQ